MEKALLISDSLVGSLCKEIEFISERTKFIKNSLLNCNDQSLKSRLLQQLETYKYRRNEIYSISNLINKQNCSNSLSSLFLLELIKRISC